MSLEATRQEVSGEGVRVQPEGRHSRRRYAISDYSALIIWALLAVVFAVLVPETFLSIDTIRTVAATQAITGIMALALLLPMAANTFDLSIGSVMGFSVVCSASLMSKMHMQPLLAIVLTLLIGAIIGTINGVVVVRFKVNSFIATLGSATILLALIQWVTGGVQIVEGIPESFTSISDLRILTIASPFWYMLIAAAVLWYVLDFRTFGRYLYATGSNEDAARLAGVRTDRMILLSLVLSSTIASLAGLIFLAKIGSASLDAGPPYLLPAFAAVFLGATQFKARRVNVPGTLIAVFLLATGVKGLQLMGAPLWVEDLFNGLALIIAVAFAARANRVKKFA
jgi:ribose transport system permease protein